MEIKFRGLRTDTPEMVTGYYVKGTGLELGIEVENIIDLARIFHVIVNGGEFFHVKPESVARFTHFHDKNGVEIYERDKLRIISNMGDKMEYHTDAIYEVRIDPLSGVNLKFLELAWEDGAKNQIPIDLNPSVRYGSLDEDHRSGSKYRRLCIPDTWGGRIVMDQRWQNNHYTNDITVVGNLDQK